MFISIKKLVLVITCFITISAIAQEKKIDTAAAKTRSYFKADINYETNSVYLGRKDSAILPYITPTISYCHKSGFNASASMAYSSSDKRVDYFSINAGYEFRLQKNLTGSVNGTKTFYNSSSNNVSSDIGASFDAGLTYDFDVVEVHVDGGVSFATKTDFCSSASIEHAFSFGEENSEWTITPTAVLNMSTLNFYEGYTNKKTGKKTIKKNPLIASVASTTVITNTKSNNLTLMDFELTLPISYDGKKWGVYVTPTFVIPQHPIYTSTTSVIKFNNPATPAQTITTDTTPDSEKKMTNSFFAEVGFYFKF